MSELVTSPIPPDLRTLLENLKTEIFYSLNCHQVGVIESYNPSTQTASVRLSMLKTIGTEQVPYPILTDCPVMVPMGGAGYMTFPIAKGDPCLVLFNDRDIDRWFTTGNVVAPNSARAHSLSDGIVFVGIRNATNPPAQNSGSSVRIYYGNSYMLVGNGSAQLGSDLGAVVSLGAKVRVGNNSTTLLLALNELCDTMTNWVNTGGSTPNAGTLAAITATKATINSLLN